MTDRSSAPAGFSDTASADSVDRDIVDVVGIGFGPSNLALAIAFEEHRQNAAGEQITARFFERRTEFAWHPDMVLEGSTMQIAFPKDLVTFRNPTSSYSFFSYLHAQNRLVDFVNHQTFFPTRVEFQDYLQWAAGRVDADVRYGTEVAGVTPIRNAHGVADLWHVHTSDGDVYARNIVMGMGLRARIPEGVTQSARCFHNQRFLSAIEAMPEPTHQRFVVVGAGQSAAEVVQFLHTNYPDAEVHNVFSRFGYSPADDSPYANRIFDPSVVDELYSAPCSERERLLELHRSTNYSVVDPELIESIYAAEYRERVRGPRRLFMRRACEVLGITESDTGVEVQIRNTLDGSTDTLGCDAVVLATGFEAAPLGTILGDAVQESAVPPVGRNYRLATGDDIVAGIYLQGGTEKTHGLTSSLLSNVAIRSGEILASILEERLRGGPAGQVDFGELDRLPNQHTYATSEAR